MDINIPRVAMIILIISFMVTSIAVSSGVLADLTCEVKDTCSGEGEVILLRISRDTGGHAELPSVDPPHYPNLLCCGSNTYSLGNTNADDYVTFLELSGQTNAHVEKTNGPEVGYSVGANISVSNGDISCDYQEDDCDGWDACLASISGPTNAHAGNCEAFDTKVCCKIESIGFGTVTFKDPTPPGGDIETSAFVINVSVVNDTHPIDKVWVRWIDKSDPLNPIEINKSITPGINIGNAYYYHITVPAAGMPSMVVGGTYSFTVYANNTISQEKKTGEISVTIVSDLLVTFEDPTPPNNQIAMGNSLFINVTVYNKSFAIQDVYAILQNGTDEKRHTLSFGGNIDVNNNFYFTEITGLANNPFAVYNYTVFVEDDVNTKVNTSNRTITLTTLLTTIDIQDTLPNYVKDYTVNLDLVYTNIADFTETCYLKNDSDAWASEPCLTGSRPDWNLPVQNGNHTVHFNVSVEDISRNASDWVVVDDLPPISSITTPLREYLYEETMIDNLAWEGDDQKLDDGTDGIGVDCYTLQYMVTDEEDVQVVGWTDLGTCTSATSHDDINLVVLAGMTNPEDVDMYTFYFRTISRDMLGNEENKGNLEDVSTTVFFPKYADVRVFTEYGEVPISGGVTSANSPVNLSVRSKHPYGINIVINYSLTGPNQGLVWQQRVCPPSLTIGQYCNITLDPQGQDKELNFWVHSVESTDPNNFEYSPPGAPNAYWTVYFYEHPIAEFQSGDLYLPIGTHYVIPVKVRNILNQDSQITVSLGGGFGQYAKFLVDGQTLGYGQEWTSTFNRQEERTISVEIAGANINQGEPYRLRLTGENPPVPEDTHIINIDVSLPSEFPGINMLGIALIMVFSVMVFYGFATKK